MKNSILLILSLILVSCIEELDDLDPNFEKVFGYNIRSRSNGISQNSDNSYMVFGWTERTIQDFDTYQVDVNKDARMPFLVQFDQNGNQILTRSYPFGQVEYNLSAFGDIFDIDFMEIADVKELPNGKFLAVLFGGNDESYHLAYMILNKDLNIEKFKLFDDSEIEFKNTNLVTRGGHKILDTPFDDEVHIIARTSYFLTPDYWIMPQTRFYSIIKMSFDGEIKEIQDFDNNTYPLNTFDAIYDSRGDLIILGQNGYNEGEIFLHKVDPRDGTVLNTKTIINDTIARRNVTRILETESGYLFIERIRTPEIQSTVAMTFVDNEFDLIKSIVYPSIRYPICYFRDIIPNKEGGYYALSYACQGLITLFKLDKSGSEIWRWEKESNADDGPLYGFLSLAVDGGVILVRNQNFNDSGYKITLLKIDRNGNL